MDVDHELCQVEFRVLGYKEEVQEGYSLTTLAHAQGYLALVTQAYCSSTAFENRDIVRLKNGFIRGPREGNGQCLLEHTYPLSYRGKIKYKLVSIKPKSGKELTKEDCLKALAFAAELDDVEEVEELLKCAGIDILRIRFPVADFATILHVCTYWASVDTLAKVLTVYPVSDDVYILDNYGDTALHNLPNDTHPRKSYEDCKRAACLLLGFHGVNANKLLSKQNNYGRLTAVCKALVYEQQDVCRALLDAGKEKQEEEASTLEASKGAPHWLTFPAHADRRYHCLYDDDEDDNAFCTALHLAVLKKYGDIVTKILEYPGAAGLQLTSQRDHNGNTPLHLAAKVGDPEICLMLLKYSMQEINKDGGSAVRSLNEVGETALHIASTHGHAEVCAKLLAYGGSSLISVKDKQGRYALTNAFAKGRKQVVEKLLDACLLAAQDAPASAKSDLNTKSKRSLINERFELGLTPLHVAAAICSLDHISRLLSAGAEVDSRCDKGRSPLHFATQEYERGAFFELLEAGKKLDAKEKKPKWINMKDISGRTALHNVVRLSRHDQSESSEVEISHSQLLKAHRIADMVRELIREGASVHLQDCQGETALHEAMRSHDKVVLTLLSATKDSINDRDKWIAMCDFSGETALHEAARAGRLNLVQHLLKETTSCDDLLRVRDMENMTALDYAALNRDDAMMDEMVKNHEISGVTKDFLMWHLKQHINPRDHERYCKKYEVKESQTSLLHAAVKNEDVDIARELINRGVDVTSLEYDACRWLALNFGKNTSDQPTSEDTLGRKQLVQGVAALLLNPYTQTPVAIGIFGSWGTGKSSFMLQVEEAMLYMAVKETFRKTPDDSPFHDKEFSRTGAMLRCMVVKALTERMIKGDASSQSTSGKALLVKIIKVAKKSIEKEMRSCRKPQDNQASKEKPDIENDMPPKDEEVDIKNSSMDGDINISSSVELSKYRQFFKDLASIDRSKSDGDINISSSVELLKYRQFFKDLASIDRSKSEYDIFPMDLQSKYRQLFKDLALLDIPMLENDIISNSLLELQSKYQQLFTDLVSIDRSELEYDIINKFPMELQSKYLQFFKDLALTDRSKLVPSHARARKSGISNQTLQDVHLIGYSPAVLTLHYNAWQYDNKTEASAGLAVELCHQLESFMTPHQWLRMCWKYSWKSRPRDICVHVLLPILLALVAICVILMLWKLIPIAKQYKGFSIPIGIAGAMWVFFKTSLQAIKPVSQALLTLTKSIDHRSMLGYQHEVIDDIKFLIDQLCHDAHFGWKILSFLCLPFISNKYFMEGTWIWKQHPRLDNFRIVVLIDDLDRCDEKTILELLRAINLILGSCGINVVIGVDKKMVERAITREFLKDTGDKVFDIWSENTGNTKKEGPEVETIEEGKNPQNVNANDNKYLYARDLAENYLQKIIQLPIQIPEPSVGHIECFLQGQVGHERLTRPQKDKVNDEEDAQNQRLIEGGGEDSQINHVKGDARSQELIEEVKQVTDEGDIQSQGASGPMRFRLLLTNYTPMEKDMLKRICRLTTKERRVPREFKRFLNYHRLAWTILSQDHNMKSKAFKGWQRKLILWIFICWNWRDQMDVIFEVCYQACTTYIIVIYYKWWFRCIAK